jgi:hypothetical protein
MQKRGLVVALVLGVLFVSLAFASAFSFSDFFSNLFGGKVTGNVVAGIDNGLIGYYKFDESTVQTTTAADSSGNNKNGAISSGVTSISGKFSHAFRFSGSASVSVQGLDFSSKEYTISGWVRTTQPAEAERWRNWINKNDYETTPFELGIDDGRNTNVSYFATWIYGQGAPVSIYANDGSNMRDGQWHHIVATYKKGEQRLYHNGALISTSSFNQDFPTTSSAVYIGGQQLGYYHRPWIGDIDEVRIYNRVLNTSEIWQLYSQTSSSFSGGGGGCAENWTCSSWSGCANNQQIRYCVDTNNCTTIFNKPSTNQSCSSPPTPVNCTDSDGGLNYNQPGYINYTGTIIPDSCCAGNNYVADCTGHPSRLQEFYCINNSNYVQFYDCPNGCSNGACISQTNSTKTLTKQAVSSENIQELNDISKAKLQNLLQNADNGSISVPTINLQAGIQFGVAFALRNIETGSVSSTTFYYKLKLDDSDIAKNCGISALEALKWAQFGEGYMAIIPGNTEYNRILFTVPKNALACSTKFRILVYRPSKGESQDTPYADSAFYLNLSSAPITNPVCADLIKEVKNPTSTKERKVSWNNTYDGNWYVNGKEEHYNTYSASWSWNSPVYRENEMNYYYASYYIDVFDNQNIDLSNHLQWNKNNPACKTTAYWLYGQKNSYYICNWDALNNRQSTDDYQSINRQISWVNGNVVVRMYLYSGNQLSDTEVIKLSQQKLNDLINNLQNNQYKYIDWSNFNINYPMSNELLNTLEKCKSEIKVNNSVPTPSWNCKTEPVICPEYGYQTRTCTSWNYETEKEDKNEEKIYCSPGICSGCYTPRWSFSSSSDNVCVPYGTRLIFERGDDSDKITQADINSHIQEFNFTINKDRSAKITILQLPNEIKSITANGVTYDQVGDSMTIYQGNEYDISINFADTRKPESIKVKVNTLFYSDNPEKSYIELRMVENYNAYCNYNGEIYQQKTKDYNNNWAKCQNNYECESNLCSSGECIELKAIADQASSIKSFFIRMICKLSNLFDEAAYSQCIIDYSA